jgi:hypothetical protein
MPSNPQLKLMTELLQLEGVIVTNYQIIKEIGIVFHSNCLDRQKKIGSLVERVISFANRQKLLTTLI